MIGFPTVYGGHSTLMSPAAFIRRPQRWIHALAAGSRHGRVVTAAPNFACEYAAQRGLPAPGDDVDLSNVVLILGSEPVSIKRHRGLQHRLRAIRVAADGDQTVVRHRRGDPVRLDHRARPPGPPSPTSTEQKLERGEAVRVAADAPDAVAHVSCGQIARSQWCVIVDSDTGTELPDGRVGEIWLHGNNIGHGYWGRPEETRQTFGAVLRSQTAEGSHARRRSRLARSGCGPGTWGSTSTVSCMSPAASRI